MGPIVLCLFLCLGASCQVDDSALGYPPATGAAASVAGSLRDSRRLDNSGSLELPGRARLFTRTRELAFSPSATGRRPSSPGYELQTEGTLKKGNAISLQPHGVAAMGAQSVLFVSARKAYYKDPGQAQILVWNPTELTLERSIQLPTDLVFPDYLATFCQWASRAGEGTTKQ